MPTVKSKYPGCRCSSCSLRERPFVPPVGDGKVVVLGEAPGAEEVVRKEPFVGRSGQLLRQVLDRARVTELGLHITNVCLCNPPRNVTPSPSDVRACWTDRAPGEMEGAEIILGVGNTPLLALMGEKGGITQWRGRTVFNERLGVWTTFTYHPAFLLRSPGGFRDFVEDIGRIHKILRWPREAGWSPHPMVKWQVWNSPAYATRALNKLLRGVVGTNQAVALDLETTSLAYREAKIVCCALSTGKETKVITGRVFQDPRFWRVFGKWVQHPSVVWTYQNASYDMKVLRHLGLSPHLGHDTMMMHYCLDERVGTHSLEMLERRYLCAEKHEDTFTEAWDRCQAKYGADAHYGLIEPIEVLWEYNARDAYYTWRLWHVLADKMTAGNWTLYERLLRPLVDRKQRLEMRGILVDQELMRDRSLAVQEEAKVMREALSQMVGVEGLNPGSSQQMCVVLYDQLRIPKYRGQRTTNKDVLAIIRKRIPSGSLQAGVMDTLKEWRKLAKLDSTYLRGFFKWIDDDGRVRTEYLAHGTPTGRFASRNPNLQNIPRRPDIRDIFMAPSGWTLIEADYSQIELRVLAILSWDQELMRIFREGVDLHDEVAVDFFGEGFDSEQRMRAKAVNFGIGYGRSAMSIAEEFGIPLREATAYRNRWLRRFPQAAAYIGAIREQALTGVSVVNPLGRRRSFPLILPGVKMIETQNEANNFPMQSTASDLTQLSLIRIVDEWQGEADRGLVLNVHDSLVAEVKSGVVDECVNMMVTTMVDVAYEVLGRDIPFVVDAKVGPRWGSLKEVKSGP